MKWSSYFSAKKLLFAIVETISGGSATDQNADNK